MQTDHELITLSEKTQCPVHLTSEKVQGSLPHCSHIQKIESRNIFRQKAFPQDINHFQEKVKHSSGSLIWKKLREQLGLEEQRDPLLAEATSEILKQKCKVDFFLTLAFVNVKDKLIPIVWKWIA